MKYITFRFDVDTHKCIHKGVPNLTKIAKKQKVQFTFFINTGRAINRTLSLKKILLRSKKKSSNSLSSFKKLGFKDYLKIIAFNPKVAQSFQHTVRTLQKENHEIGLHGGRNHEAWYENAHLWSKNTLNSEILWGIMQMKKIEHSIKLVGFASPGWNSNKHLASVLKAHNFSYLADTHCLRCEDITISSGLKCIPTNILGEPGGVGYLEYCRAKNMSDREIMADFTKKLDSKKKYAIMYDHPYYAGIHEILMLQKMIAIAKQKGFKFTTLSKLAKK